MFLDGIPCQINIIFPSAGDIHIPYIRERERRRRRRNIWGNVHEDGRVRGLIWLSFRHARPRLCCETSLEKVE